MFSSNQKNTSYTKPYHLLTYLVLIVLFLIIFQNFFEYGYISLNEISILEVDMNN